MINKFLKALGISLLVFAEDCYAAESAEGDSCDYFSMSGSNSQSQEDTPQPKTLNIALLKDTTLNEYKEKPGVNYIIKIYINKTDSQLYWPKYTTIVLVSLGSFILGASVVYWYMREHKS